MMWEDPRPERIREVESRRGSVFGPAVLGIAAVAGVFAIMLNAGLVSCRISGSADTEEVGRATP